MKLIFENKSSNKPLVSIIILDWSCRESFHVLHYLNHQVIPREQYEVVWIEYYSRRSPEIEAWLNECETFHKPPVVDKWVVMEMPDSIYYHKHLMYNTGIIMSKGDIVIICDSDAMVTENFIKTVIKSFEKDDKIVLHLDEFRNIRHDLYPFNYPGFDDVIGEGCVNNADGKTAGVIDAEDPIHTRNYGACMCAKRADLIAIGGADEHIDYLGHVCGPYEMTFRLVNYGLREIWHESEFLYHTWHPGQAGEKNYVGPHDGRHVSTTALEALKSGRIMPLVENEVIRLMRMCGTYTYETLQDKLVNSGYYNDWKYKSISKSPNFNVWYNPELLDSIMGYNILKYRERFYAIPQSLGPVDLSKKEQRNNPAILSAKTQRKVERLIVNEVEYAGWLPVYARFGNCGNHPQFAHLGLPPQGYKFVMSKPPALQNSESSIDRQYVKLIKLFRLFALSVPVAKLAFSSFRNGAKYYQIVQFLNTRDRPSQLLLPRKLDIVFLPSVPYTYGQHPWIIEIEDTTSLFFPFEHNGNTNSIQASNIECFPMVKALLQSKNCRGIITHVKSTAESIPRLFNDAKLGKKVTYIPLGIKLPPKKHLDKADSKHVNILFTNSWHQDPRSFFARGGIDLLEAFAILNKKYPNVRLTLRTKLPSDLDPPFKLDNRYIEIIKTCNVRVIDKFLTSNEWQQLLSQSDVYVLPSARIHVVSILEAMSYSLALVVSDGWAIEEYVKDGVNGMVVKGRYGKTSWMDSENGILRENYTSLFTADPVVVEGLVRALSALIEDKGLCEKLGKAARQDVEITYNIENWNKGLKEAFDKALDKKF